MMLSIFLLLLSLLGVASASSSSCIAIDSSSDSYVCTDNPPETRRAVAGRAYSSVDDIDVGVPQRISGSPGKT